MSDNDDGLSIDASSYRRYLKPSVYRLLHTIGLDVAYERAEGDFLYFRDPAGQSVSVLDLIGGFGAALLGHNHPEIVAAAQKSLAEQRPFHAQGSVRARAGRLAGELRDVVGESTGRSYMVTLANSGTEAVEAAIKHAELEAVRRLQGIERDVNRKLGEFRTRMPGGAANLPAECWNRIGREFDRQQPCDWRTLADLVARHNRSAFSEPPTFLALDGGFHGKTTGSLGLTHNPEYRECWQRLGYRVVFLPPGNEESLHRAIDEARIEYLALKLREDGGLEVTRQTVGNVAATFVEPIQGEGGIREIPHDYLRLLRRTADEQGFPLVFDEIQSGMGRTGTFLASQASGVAGDYYLLSKSLGGGLGKLSALLIDAERYQDDFGYLHTSTFAEDDFSCDVALKALDVVRRDGYALLNQCRDKGRYLIDRLNTLRERYPGQVQAVRGRGLMVGIEMAAQHESASPLLRVLSEQGMLGYLACGWLLNNRRIRVAPTLSAPNVIRVEPSAYISHENLDRFCRALEELLTAIRAGNSLELTQFLVEERQREAPPSIRVAATPRKVALIGHFLEPGDLRHWEPGFAPLSDEQCQALLTRICDSVEPFVVREGVVQSRHGSVHATVIGLAFSSEQAAESYRAGTHGWSVELVEKAVALARQKGCSVAGLAGYTSIITGSCTDLVETGIALTSGNSLAAASALEALLRSARLAEIKRPRLGIVGGVGNIGSVLTEVAADQVGSIVLVGRKGARRRLGELADRLYAKAWQELQQERSHNGLAGTLAETDAVRQFSCCSSTAEDGLGTRLRNAVEQELGQRSPVSISEELSALKDCNLIISATNAPRPIIDSSHLGCGPVVVCDVAAPGDLDPAITESRPDVTALKGGIIKLPQNQTFDIPGMPIPRGELYACLAETLLLGLEGVDEHFSYGPLSADRVRSIRQSAQKHGFEIQERPL